MQVGLVEAEVLLVLCLGARLKPVVEIDPELLSRHDPDGRRNKIARFRSRSNE